MTMKPPTSGSYYAYTSEDDRPARHTTTSTVDGSLTSNAFRSASQNELWAPVQEPSTTPIWRTLVLLKFSVLNFALSAAAFSLTSIVLIACLLLLPLCGLGYFLYVYSIPVFRSLAVFDVMLANTITPEADDRVRWNVPDYDAPGHSTTDDAASLRLAPRLSQPSGRSTVVVLYFVTIKWAIGLLNLMAVALPILPIVSHVVADHTDKTNASYVAGYNAHKFNFHTDPVWYTLAWVGYIVGGIIAIHLMARISRMLTRCICCDLPNRSRSVV